MKALIMILENTKEGTFHPIFYYENPFAGEDNKSVVRYKSKGHHSSGFATLEEARDSIPSLVSRIEGQGYMVNVEIDSLLGWDGIEIPADNQLRGI